MAELLDIAEVVRRTGLTSRALRFWEARGLLKPVRTASGRRYYGPDELERLHAVIALKRAGFSLGAIGEMLGDRRADLGRLSRRNWPNSKRAHANWPTRAACFRISCPASIPASGSTSRRSAR